MGRASIAANLVPSGFLEASDGASIHRCQPGTVGFPRLSDGARSIAANLVTSYVLEASDAASIHRCQPGNVICPRSIRWGQHPSLPTW